MLIGRKGRHPAAGLDLDRDDLRLEVPLLPSLSRPPLGSVGHLVGLLPRDAILLSEFLGGLRPIEYTLRIGQGCPEGTFEGAPRIAESQIAPTRSSNDVWRLAHRFGSATDRDLEFPEEDLLGSGDDRLETRPAEPVQGERRCLDR